MCSGPVGLGAKRTLTFDGILLVKVARPSTKYESLESVIRLSLVSLHVVPDDRISGIGVAGIDLENARQ